jgi:hypothetical protein
LLKKGALLKKWGNGKSEERFFWVNEDGSELRWAKPSIKSQKLEADLAAGAISTAKITSYKKLELGDISFMVFGPRTKRFIGYDWLRAHPEDCFSVILPDGDTLDIECANRQEFMTWYLGIRCLAPLSRKTYDRAQINWHRALYRTMQYAKNNQLDVMEIWHALVSMSKQGDDEQSLTELQLSIVLNFTGETVLVNRDGLKKRRDQITVVQARRSINKLTPPIVGKYSDDIIMVDSPRLHGSKANLDDIDGVSRLARHHSREEY